MCLTHLSTVNFFQMFKHTKHFILPNPHSLPFFFSNLDWVLSKPNEQLFSRNPFLCPPASNPLFSASYVFINFLHCFMQVHLLEAFYETTLMIQLL